MDLPELLIQRGGSCLRGRVFLRIVHLQVPVDEVTLSKTNHFHARKTKDYFWWSSQIWVAGSGSCCNFAPGASCLSIDTKRQALRWPMYPVSGFSWPNTSFSSFRVKASSQCDFLLTPEHIWPRHPTFRTRRPHGWHGNTAGGTPQCDSFYSFLSFPIALRDNWKGMFTFALNWRTKGMRVH